MQFEPMIKARINSFKTHHALSNIPEDKLFELFVNDVVLRSHQPDVGISEEVILDECSVGGADDMGIDGLAIKVNGIFVSTKQDIDELVELNKQISIEFLFIQSKNKGQHRTNGKIHRIAVVAERTLWITSELLFAKAR